jgi:hypothetical protein
LSEDKLADDIFGITGDAMNMKSQYLDCSFDQFELNQADDRTGKITSIQNGVTTVEVDLATSDGTFAILNAITEQLLTEFSTDAENLADYTMYCMPPGTMRDTEVAFAFLNGYQSWYNDEACSYVSAQMHEVGHNIVSSVISWPHSIAILHLLFMIVVRPTIKGMGHSSEDGAEYRDQSGLVSIQRGTLDLAVACSEDLLYYLLRIRENRWVSPMNTTMFRSCASSKYSCF